MPITSEEIYQASKSYIDNSSQENLAKVKELIIRGAEENDNSFEKMEQVGIESFTRAVQDSITLNRLVAEQMRNYAGAPNQLMTMESIRSATILQMTNDARIFVKAILREAQAPTPPLPIVHTIS